MDHSDNQPHGVSRAPAPPDFYEKRRAETASVRQRLDTFLARLADGGARIVPLTGDASDRHYFRYVVDHGRSRVLAVYAGPFEFDTMPFVNVARLMAQMPLPVPAILGHHDDLGIMELQDLGDTTLQAHLGAASDAERWKLYLRAVELIALLQHRGAELASPSYLPYQAAFDVEKLTWELNFFVQHFLVGYRGVALTDALREALAAAFRPIVEELAAQPRVLCHRDYHSRNLMIHEGRLYVIDFQDARMGPDTYDLVSLLRDSYVDLPEAEVQALIAHFISLTGREAQAGAVKDRFDLMALQRNLKALGTFGYQTTARRNPVYLQYIPRTLRYVRENLRAHERFAGLRDALGRLIEELR